MNMARVSVHVSVCAYTCNVYACTCACVLVCVCLRMCVCVSACMCVY